MERQPGQRRRGGPIKRTPGLAGPPKRVPLSDVTIAALNEEVGELRDTVQMQNDAITVLLARLAILEQSVFDLEEERQRKPFTDTRQLDAEIK